MPKRRRSKAFWKNFKFKYKLTIVNENTLEEIVGLRVSKLNGLSVLLCVLAVLFLIASCIITFTPLRNYLPGYMNSEIRAPGSGECLTRRFPPATGEQTEPLYHEYPGHLPGQDKGRYHTLHRLVNPPARRFAHGTHTTGSRIPQTVRGDRKSTT